MRRHLGVAAALLLVVPLGACSGSSDDSARKSAAAPAKDPDVEVRWPRYWATTDQAESGARGASNARFFVGADGKYVVYNAQDIMRVIDSETGKQVHQTLTSGREVICAFQPSPVIEDHVVVLATGLNGSDGVQDCQTVRGYDVEKGKFIWAAKYRLPGEMSIGVRDGSVLVGQKYQDAAKANAIEYTMSGLDLATGKVRWTKQAAETYVDDEAPEDLSDCAVQPAIAASEPVAIAVSTCYVSGGEIGEDDPARVGGYDLESGKRLWSKDADWLKVSEDGYGLGGDLKPHPNDGSFIPGTRYVGASYVDAKTGKGRTVAAPDVERYKGSEDNSFEASNDFGSLGGSFADFSVLAAGDVDLYVAQPISEDKSMRLRIEGVTAESGKSRYVIDLKKKPKKDDYEPDYTFLGLDVTRKQFLISTDEEHVERYDVSTGKKVGSGQLAPPLGLTKSATWGKGYLVVRGQGGITGGSRDVLSGIDYYRTDTD